VGEEVVRHLHRRGAVEQLGEGIRLDGRRRGGALASRGGPRAVDEEAAAQVGDELDGEDLVGRRVSQSGQAQAGWVRAQEGRMRGKRHAARRPWRASRRSSQRTPWFAGGDEGERGVGSEWFAAAGAQSLLISRRSPPPSGLAAVWRGPRFWLRRGLRHSPHMEPSKQLQPGGATTTSTRCLRGQASQVPFALPPRESSRCVRGRRRAGWCCAGSGLARHSGGSPPLSRPRYSPGRMGAWCMVHGLVEQASPSSVSSPGLPLAPAPAPAPAPASVPHHHRRCPRAPARPHPRLPCTRRRCGTTRPSSARLASSPA
jgi:hypothetical protein